MSKVIISGGGTGGHVFPAIAIADELKKRRPDIDILFVGAEGKIEMEKVPKAGYPIKGLWISGFHRKLTLRNLMFPFKLLSSLWKSYWIVKSFKPDVAVGTGGFASGPVLQIANFFDIPTLLQEQNSYAGVTNKLLSKKANTICVAYDQMERYFPSNKIVITGNPVRKDIAEGNADRGKAYSHFGLDPDKQTIIIVGGSLGARSLNEGVRASYELLKANPDVQLLWQCGKLYIEEFATCESAKLPHVKASAFIDRMDLAYAMADVVIARSGASTISELCIAGKATVLVPSPNVAEDHQTKNAQALELKEAAVLVRDSEVKEKMLATALEILRDKNRQRSLEDNILKMAKPKAAESIAEEVMKLIDRTKE
jgi:UDP-N-acetylglucosamine--N-acetylmuramyl-(pentapeptide) pyrophosphoryl-undecaprenol N-acetylglucosamine transferase